MSKHKQFKSIVEKPKLTQERILWCQGKKKVVGLDEVGVGALAGPVFAAAASFRRGFSPSHALRQLIRDSKALSPLQREKAFKNLMAIPGFVWSVSRVSPAVIDRLNIRQAVSLAMRRCLKKLGTVDFVLVDGVSLLKRYPIPQKAIVRGDKKIFSIAAASVIAKVLRDRHMKRLARREPRYAFEIHKGYGTLLHRKHLQKYGLSQEHRVTFCDHLNVAK